MVETASAQIVAFTFDDGPKLERTPLLSPQQRNDAMLAALARHRVKAALFVTWNLGADRVDGLALARAWGEAGHFLADHTLSHPDLNDAGITLAAYQEEILACAGHIRPLPGFRPWLRYTYLRQGNTPEKVAGMRRFLQEQGLRNAYVTLDTSDWRLNQALVQTLQAKPDADLAPFRTVYMSHLRQRAEAYRALGLRLFGREIPHILLIHHNLLNALFLDDAIRLFRAMGWTITDPETAYRDFVYTLDPQRPAPGQSLLISAGRSLGYLPPDWERMLDDGDAEIAELRRLGALAEAGEAK